MEILSGVFEGRTTGTPISLIVYNRDVKSQDYDALRDLFRPGHGDLTYQAKYGIRDHRGGGRASARETVARVAAGAVAQKVLDRGPYPGGGLYPGAGRSAGRKDRRSHYLGQSLLLPRRRESWRPWTPG